MRNYLLQSGLPYLWITYLWIFNVLDFVLIITRKLIETNSQSFWEYEHYWVILPFLSCLLFFLFFVFFSPVQRSRLQCKGKFTFPYVLCFYKSKYHINVVFHTPSFLSNSFYERKLNHLNVLMTFTNKANSSFRG